MTEEQEYKTDPLLDGVVTLAQNEMELVLNKFTKTIPGLRFNVILEASYEQPEEIE
jgi:hypothetical protein